MPAGLCAQEMISLKNFAFVPDVFIFNIKQICKFYLFCLENILSVIRQKGKSRNGCYKKTKHDKCSFFGKFGVLCFLVAPVLRFAPLPYCLRFAVTLPNIIKYS